MKVHIIAKFPYPTGMASTQRIACYAEALAKNGIRNEVVIIKRTETANNVKNTSLNGGSSLSSFHYIGRTTVRSKNQILGILADISDRIKSILYLYKTIQKGDVVLLYLLEEVAYPFLLIILSHLKGAFIVRDFCEYPYATYSDRPFANFMRKVYLRFFFPKYDGTLCISHALLDIAKQYAPRRHHELIPIMVGDTHTNKRYLHPRPYIFHGGSMLERKDAILSTMKAFIDANTILGKKLDFILAGPPSPHINELTKMIRQGGMEASVVFHPIMDQSTLQEYQNGAFLTILNKNDNKQNQHGFSNKLGEVLISGTPVITTTVGEAKYWLKDGESAYIVAPHDPKLISKKILEAYNDVEKRKRVGEEGLSVAKKYFNTTSQGKVLFAYLKKLTKSNSSLS